MPTILNWFLRLLPTNPICMRLVQGGSRRLRHLYIRSGYLAVIIIVLLFVLLGSASGRLSLRELAGAGAEMFRNISILQVGLICLLTPVFMAGAIAQEANPKTWDIVLTTPLNNLQIVLGNLFGRLFFVVALLFSSLPLFVMTQYFGGVPGESIFASYAIAGTSALLVAAIAVTLSVTRTAGRRAVFIFYVSVVMYLFITGGADQFGIKSLGTGAGTARFTSYFTPLNPFLALKVLLDSNNYVPHDFTGIEASWIRRIWLGRPIATFCWLCAGISLVLVLFSTLRLRVIGARVGAIPLHRRVLGLRARNANERPPRSVSKNPISWRESVARGNTPAAILGRWGFVAVGIIVAIVILSLYHTGQLDSADLRMVIMVVVGAEIVIISLVAVQMSATAVAREREDGTLDLILTTPIQPGPYIRGKHRGLVQFLVPMMSVPVVTMTLIAIYMLLGGLGRAGGVMVADPNPRGTGNFPAMYAILPEVAITLPLMLGPFIAFCVMVGLQWSIKSKGTIGAVIAAFGLVLAVAGVLGLCGVPSGQNLSFIGAVLNAFSPLNLLASEVFAARTIPHALSDGIAGARASVLIGAAAAAVGYTLISYGIHTNMKRTFMMTVRRLAGAN